MSSEFDLLPDLRPESAESPGIPRWKLFLDLRWIFLAFSVVLPVGFLIALIIRAVSPGPALFKQPCVGYRGRRFMLFKFRTMVVNADNISHQTYQADLITANRRMNKLDDSGDPRLLPAGRSIRALELDELPQLLNVNRPSHLAAPALSGAGVLVSLQSLRLE